MSETNNITLVDLFSDIANAIRERTGRSERIVADDFPFALASIPDSSVFLSIVNKSITELPITYLEGITSIGDYTFSNCSNLALTSLPESITSIGIRAFYNCGNLSLTSLPAGITSIGDNAFYYCSKLTTLTFKGTPTSIASNAFPYCHNLKTINVPWAEGAVANAPWGATNAAINYNYTGD